LRAPLLLALAAATSVAASDLPAWARHTMAGHMAVAEESEVDPGRAFCLALGAAPFGPEDPRYAILLANALDVGYLGPTPTLECEELAPTLLEPDAAGRRGIPRAWAMVRSHGLEDDPRFLPLRRSLTIFRLGAAGLVGGPQADWEGMGVPDRDAEIHALADLIQSHARAFGEHASGPPESPTFGLEEPREGAASSWVTGAHRDRAHRLWPRAVLFLEPTYPQSLQDGMWPVHALDRLGQDWDSVDEGSPRGWELREQALALADRLLGPEHPLALLERLRLAHEEVGEVHLRERWRQGIARLEDLRDRLARAVESPDHRNLLWIQVLLARLHRRHGQPMLARVALEAAARCARAPEDDGKEARALRVRLGAWAPRGVPSPAFHWRAEEQFHALLDGGLEALAPVHAYAPRDDGECETCRLQGR
jgi:hypothetical protein